MTHEKNILISAQELYLAVCKKIKGGHDSIDAFKGYFEALDLLYSEPKLGDFVPTNKKGEVMVKKNISAIEEFNGKEVILKHQYGISDSKDLYLNTESSGRLEIEDGWIYLYDKGKSGKYFKKAFQRSRIDKIGYRIFWIAPIEYQSALDRVIWKGWEVKQRGSYKTLQRIDEVIAECYNDSTKWDWYGVESYEKLITSGVKLERITKEITKT